MRLRGKLNLPQNHAAMLGRVTQAWSQLEFQVDLGIWHLLATPQQLAACVTAQLNFMAPKFNAFISLAQVSGCPEKTIGELNKFYSKRISGLMEKRNRAAHDPRMTRKADSVVCRMTISAKAGRTTFGFIEEPMDDLKKTYNEIYQTTKDFIALRNKAIKQIEELPEEDQPIFSSMIHS